MATQGDLFDDVSQLPTTRAVARLVKIGGPEHLPGLVRRADKARYQEIACRSALNRVDGMPFRWTLNPYRGCTHGCHYCFARRYQSHLELDAGDAFSSIIFVKVNLPDVLRRELRHPAWCRETVALGTATDPYQPIEGRYRLTRRTLEALLDARTPVGLVTKGPMVVRDADLLVKLGQRAGCTVCVSVPTVDEDVWSSLEPGTAPPVQRLRAVRALRDKGVTAGVLLAPVVPGLTTSRGRLDRTLRAVAEHGAAFLGASVLHLDGATREHFLGFLARDYPHLMDGYRRLYVRKHVPQSYAGQVHDAIDALRSVYGLSPPGIRPQVSAPGSPDRGAVQPRLQCRYD